MAATDNATVRPDFDRNDLIYRSPPIHGHQGWLFGAEGAGATLWNPADRLSVQFGHTDLIDRGSSDSDDTERSRVTPCLRHAGQFHLMVDDASLFDPLDIVEYSSRLSLADGELKVSGQSAWGEFAFEAIYGRYPAVFRLKYCDELAEAAERVVVLQRLHSRVLPTPWAEIADDASPTATDHKKATHVALREGVWLVSYHDAGFESALALAIESCETGTVEALVPSVRASEIRLRLPAMRSASIVVRVAVGVATDDRSAADTAVTTLKRSLELESEAWLEASRAKRRAAYAPSSRNLPEDRYWEQLWYTGRYHLRASGEGETPAFFVNGPWGWQRDIRAWASCWFNWNMHGSHLSIPELGDWDLFRPYSGWRMRQVDVYREITRREFGLSGVAFQDQQLPDGGTWKGKGATGRMKDKHFIASGTKAALHLYRYWRFTRDADYLQEVVYPYFEDIVRFWRDYLKEDESGILHSPRTVPYEYHSNHGFRDCLTDLELLRTALPAFAYTAVEAGKGHDLADWARNAVGRLATVPTLPLPADFVTQAGDDGERYYDNPFFYGQKYMEGDELDAIGWSEEVERWITHSESHLKRIGTYGVFCSAQTAGIFPAENITSDASPEWCEVTGVDEAACAKWQRSRNALRTIRRYPVDECRADKADVAEPRIAWTGHSLELPAFSRLGLSKELRKAFDFFIDRYQMFPQGMFNYHPRKRWFGNHSLPISASGEQLRMEHDPFSLHFAFEPQGIFGEALTLSLLDCAGGVIRLFQAYDRDARITLPAWDGFIVTAEQKNGELCPVRIQSRLGGVCQIRIPWEKARIVDGLSDGVESFEQVPEKGRVSFDTLAGREYIVADAATPVGDPSTDTAPPRADTVEPSPKAYNRHAVLGLLKRM